MLYIVLMNYKIYYIILSLIYYINLLYYKIYYIILWLFNLLYIYVQYLILEFHYVEEKNARRFYS